MQAKPTLLVLSAALVAVIFLISGYFGYRYYSLNQTSFLDQHWQKPMLPQGVPPAHFSELEASLSPEACGQCHQQQYADWQQSLHSKTMQAGILWQLRLMPQNEANKCLDCHAPLAEQKALVAVEQDWPNAPTAQLPGYVSADLARQGIVCAACHVRNHKRFGPEPSTTDAQKAMGNTAHNGFVVQPEFERSEFCAGCHQFAEDSPRTAGKLRENTYQEWLASPYSGQGVQCQSCHMPDRRHQWQGIHYPAMVEQAVSTELSLQNNRVIAKVTNTGAGHLFPTYMVPKIHVQLVLVSPQGERLLTERIIGWQVSADLLTEEYDTRIAPNESLDLVFDLAEEPGAKLVEKGLETNVELRFVVAPAEHYERIFRNSLSYASQLDEATLALLTKAYRNAQRTRYSMLMNTLILN